MKQKVSVPFMLLGILFNVCLIAANLLETKVIQVCRHHRYCRTVSVSRFLYHQRLHCRSVGISQGAPDHLERLCHELLCGDAGTDCRCPAGCSLLGRGSPISILSLAWRRALSRQVCRHFWWARF